MKSIFRYPGGKTRSSIQRWILSHQPSGVCEYREPFVGGGGVFFAMPHRSGLVRWINDMNAGLIEVYRALAERPDEFIRLCRSIEPARDDDAVGERGVEGGKAQNARLKGHFEHMALNEACDQALRYFFVNRTVFGGRVNYDRPSRLYFSKPEGWDIVKGDQLENAAAWLAGTKITRGDYATLFDAPGEDVWIYADPPYLKNTHFTGNSKLYQHSFTVEDHAKLADAVKRCQHKVCISYDDDEEGVIRELYKGMTIIEGEWAYCGSTNEEKERGKELLILNYTPPGVFSFGVQAVENQKSLTVDELDELEQHEAVIRKAIGSFVEMGRALRVIRDRSLYRQVAKTFEEYCRSRWSITGTRAYQLLDAAQLVENLRSSTIVEELPGSESHVRELVRLRNPEGVIDHKLVTEVWSQVVESAGDRPITAKMVRAEVENVIGAPEPKPRETAAAKVIELLRRMPDVEWTGVLSFMREDRPSLVGQLLEEREECLS